MNKTIFTIAMLFISNANADLPDSLNIKGSVVQRGASCQFSGAIDYDAAFVKNPEVTEFLESLLQNYRIASGYRSHNGGYAERFIFVSPDVNSNAPVEMPRISEEKSGQYGRVLQQPFDVRPVGSASTVKVTKLYLDLYLDGLYVTASGIESNSGIIVNIDAAILRCVSVPMR